MKKSFLTFVVFAVFCFCASIGYAETKSAVKNQTELFVGASELP